MRTWSVRILSVAGMTLALSAIAGSPCILADEADIVINEIMYNPASSQGGDSQYEYIEIVNTGAEAVDMDGWTLSDDTATDTIEGCSGGSTVVPAGGYAVITDQDSLLDLKGGVHLCVDDNSICGAGLNNNGETLTLMYGDITIDQVTYAPEDGADGNGASLECANVLADNANTGNGNWAESHPPAEYGTPGITNSAASAPVAAVPQAASVILFAVGALSLAIFALLRRRGLPTQSA